MIIDNSERFRLFILKIIYYFINVFIGGEEGTIGWSAAPTLVERQRENLTERLKREFGLFLSDDEEERARKHGKYSIY